MKKLTSILLLCTASFCATVNAAQPVESEVKSYRNVPLGYTLEYSAPYTLMLRDENPDSIQPPVFGNPFTGDTLQINLLKNFNPSGKSIKDFIETHKNSPIPPGATQGTSKVNETGTKYVITYRYNNLYNTAVFSSFGPADVLYLLYQSKSSGSIPDDLQTIINSIKNTQ